VVEDIDVYDYFLFAYNPTNNDSTITLSEPMRDAKGNIYENEIIIPPWQSVILFLNPTFVGIEANNPQKNLFVYPNPASSELWVKFPDSYYGDRVSYFMADMQGKILLKGYVENPGNEIFSLNTSKLFPGMYLLCIESPDGFRYNKRVVLHR